MALTIDLSQQTPSQVVQVIPPSGKPYVVTVAQLLGLAEPGRDLDAWLDRAGVRRATPRELADI
jgi:hypothetical protein